MTGSALREMHPLGVRSNVLDPKRMLCFDSASDVETELASAQVQTTIHQMREKLREQDLTKNLNVTAEAGGALPQPAALRLRPARSDSKKKHGR